MPRSSDAHKRIAAPKALCVLREHTRPRPKSGKVRRSDTRPGDVCERTARVEGSDTTPVRNTPVSPCEPLCAIFLRKPSVYPLSRVDDSTEHWLDEIEEQLAYDAWMCGHWHVNKRIDKLHFLFHDFEAASQLNLSITQEDGGQYDGI